MRVSSVICWREGTKVEMHGGGEMKDKKRNGRKRRRKAGSVMM